MTIDPANASSIVLNGSFEDGTFSDDGFNYMRLDPGATDLTSWTVVALVAWGVDPTDGFPLDDGVAYVDLSGFGAESGAGELNQVLTTTPGRQYRLSFDSYGTQASVIADGGALTLLSGPLTGEASAWQNLYAFFTASSASTLLEIVNASPGAQIVFIDNVSVTETGAVPEPGSLFLLGSGVIGLAFRRRRARHT